MARKRWVCLESSSMGYFRVSLIHVIPLLQIFMVLFLRPFDAVQKSCNVHERGCHGVTRRFASGSRLTNDQFSGFGDATSS